MIDNSIKIKNYKEQIVLYFGCQDQGQINAYTLASTIVNFADSIKEANSIINPGFEIEVTVSALNSGSFKVVIKSFHSSLNNIFSSKPFQNIMYGVISAFIYQQTLAPPSTIINIHDNQVIIKDDKREIIVPRDTYDALKRIEKSTKFRNSISRAFSDIDNNNEISSFGLTENVDDKKPDIFIPKSKFGLLKTHLENRDEKRIIFERAELLIKTAVLKKTKKKWEFVWRGFEIKAPITDEEFYKKFYSHEIQIAPGNTLEVNLKIIQELDSSGVYINKSYEVETVYSLIPKFIQGSFKD